MTEVAPLEAWVRELFNHSGVHHSLAKPPIDLNPPVPAPIQPDAEGTPS